MSEVLIRVEGSVGSITLNRPQALNSLTLGMVREITAALREWRARADVRTILLTGAGERGLCAGGDIRALYDSARANGDLPAVFFGEEYVLNAMIARYPKPFVAWMDGIVMGGGIGLASHASHRVVTERVSVAMPEVGIGFLPDVGGTYLLGTAPGELGTHLALTAGRVGAADALLCKLADVCIASDRLPEVAAALQGCMHAAAVTAALDKLSIAPPAGALTASRAWIDACYAADSVEAILANLVAEGSPAAVRAAEEIKGKSPTSLKVTLLALREARRLARLEPCLELEYRLAQALVADGDFKEGVRAAIVDKDRKPKWQPASLGAVSDARVESLFRLFSTATLSFSA
jgi:enoyl-CoA hydratase